MNLFRCVTPSSFKAFALAAALVSAGSPALAEPTAWVGGMAGLSVPNYENTTSRQILGISGGAKVGSEFGVGAYYLSSAKDEEMTGAGTGTAFNYDMYGVELSYHFEGEANGVYLGGRIGTSKLKFDSLTTSPMHYGPVGGYNHLLGQNLSLGGELSWMSIAKSSGTPVGGTTSQTISAFNMLNFMVSAKLWF
jgi:hypothetical protein